jgi:hypothetical protein
MLKSSSALLPVRRPALVKIVDAMKIMEMLVSDCKFLCTWGSTHIVDSGSELEIHAK